MTFEFTEGLETGELAAMDQLHALYSQRVQSAVMTTMTAKLLIHGERRDRAKVLVDMLTKAINETPAFELRGMFAMTLELMANKMLDDMDEDEMNDLVRMTVKAGDDGHFDSFGD